MKLRPLIQAFQIMVYKGVLGWGNNAFQYKAVSAALFTLVLMLFSVAGSEVPDLEESNKKIGVVVDALDTGGRRGGTTLFLDEGGEIKGYGTPAFTVEELKPFAGHEAIVSIYDMSILPFVTTSVVLAVESDGLETVDKSSFMQRNSAQFRQGFLFFAKALILVELCLYLSLLHKLYTGKITFNGKNFIWASE